MAKGTFNFSTFSPEKNISTDWTSSEHNLLNRNLVFCQSNFLFMDKQNISVLLTVLWDG